MLKSTIPTETENYFVKCYVLDYVSLLDKNVEEEGCSIRKYEDDYEKFLFVYKIKFEGIQDYVYYTIFEKEQSVDYMLWFYSTYKNDECALNTIESKLIALDNKRRV